MAASIEVQDAIDRAAKQYGVNPKLLSTFVKIESGGNPQAVTGSYRGLFQLSEPEFNKYGGGNIYSAHDNAMAGAAKLKAESEQFAKQYGREPTALDLYMVHQQGPGGYAAHTSNPNAPAWQNMASTAEGRAKGEGWAKQAIWGNVPSDVRNKYPGGVDSLTSQQFMDIWRDKVARLSGDDSGNSGSPQGKTMGGVTFISDLGKNWGGNRNGGLMSRIGSATQDGGFDAQKFMSSGNQGGLLSRIGAATQGGGFDIGKFLSGPQADPNAQTAKGASSADRNAALTAMTMQEASKPEAPLPISMSPRQPVDMSGLREMLANRPLFGRIL